MDRVHREILAFAGYVRIGQHNPYLPAKRPFVDRTLKTPKSRGTSRCNYLKSRISSLAAVPDEPRKIDAADDLADFSD
jgi:hypothetical protein